ncbi:hypothetical protein [Amycolatopsis orientalis]|uniref:hypothetical protein n=1 Tax=Amycolatopsis orientalis TaxID=31958 RepID=UPI001F19F2AB|nr:hypothetical protein [Amycolatopsis orientalis]
MNIPANRRATFAAPCTGRRAAVILPPPSDHAVTSAVSSRSSPVRSPSPAADRKLSTSFSTSCGVRCPPLVRPGEIPPGPAVQLTRVDLGDVEDRGDLAMAVGEGLLQHEHGPLDRAELLQQHQHRQ